MSLYVRSPAYFRSPAKAGAQDGCEAAVKTDNSADGASAWTPAFAGEQGRLT